MKSSKQRVFLLGLDGASFDVINPLVNQGKLPGFSRIMQEGSFADLRTTLPPNTAPAWVSMTTGKNPGKHGIYDFWTSPWGNYERYIINSGSVQSPRIWDLLACEQKKSIVFNVPVTYPPLPVNGILVSGMLTPDEGYNWTYPASLKNEILAKWPGYIIDSGWTDSDTADPERYFKKTLLALEIRRQILEKFITSHDWDFCMAVFIALDRVQHFLWRYFDESHPAYDPQASLLLKNAVPEMYRQVDEIIQWLLTVLRDDDTLIIASDHGFGTLEYELYLYHWLCREGFTVLSEITLPPPPGIFPLIRDRVRTLCNKKPIPKTETIQRKQVLDNPVSRIGRGRISWEHTKAFYGTDTDCGIYINLKEKFPRGVVDEEREYRILIDEISNRLQDIKDPHGNSLIEGIYYKEDVFTGKYQHLAPDLILQTRNCTGMIMESPESSEFIVPARWRSGTHRPTGIFLAHGSNIAQVKDLKEVSIHDVAPSILHMYHMKIPGDMDGSVIEDMFRECKPVRIDNEKSSFTMPAGTPQLSGSEQERIKEKLKSLGYIS